MAVHDFTLHATDPGTSARVASFETAHGVVRTPVFMPVGTRGTVKGVTAPQLHDMGAQVLLSNTYHLFLRPGSDVVRDAGGLHRFIGWDGVILTDSGGFQIFSLADTVRFHDDGVEFRSIVDGAGHFWTPEENVRIQQDLGADIAMVLDVCPPYPAEEARVAEAVRLSAQWAERCGSAHDRADQALFGIVQGGLYQHRAHGEHRLRRIRHRGLLGR
jgi:queuine tRNA-ribosyltransferase